MKIGVLSDLHIDTNQKKLTGEETFSEIVSKQISQQQVDLMLIAGDISSDYLVSQQFLDE